MTLLLAGCLTRSVVGPVWRSRDGGSGRRGGLSGPGPGDRGRGDRIARTSLNQIGESLERRRHELDRPLREQAALRRVATLPAGERAAIFTAMVEEVGEVLGVEVVVILPPEADNSVTVMSKWAPAC